MNVLRTCAIIVTSFWTLNVQPNTSVASDVVNASLYDGIGSCLAPLETYPYKLDKSDPLYETARQDHQRFLEELEDYVNCLDRERSNALAEFHASFHLFRKNFGRDAVFRYKADGSPVGN